jgi:hypothetical protein
VLPSLAPFWDAQTLSIASEGRNLTSAERALRLNWGCSKNESNVALRRKSRIYVFRCDARYLITDIYIFIILLFMTV